jgi:hypothetical protein
VTVTASGSLSTTLEILREALAASAAFRTWAGVADAAAARLRIVWGIDVAGDAIPDRPFVEIDIPTGVEFLPVATDTHVINGSIFIFAYGLIAAANRDDNDDAMMDARNSIGALWDAVRGIQGATVGTARVELRGGSIVGQVMIDEPDRSDGVLYKHWSGQIQILYGPRV